MCIRDSLYVIHMECASGVRFLNKKIFIPAVYRNKAETSPGAGKYTDLSLIHIYFKNCELYALNRNETINSYYTAPSTYEGQKYGYVFESCSFSGNCPPRTTMLSRPWRIYAKVVLIRCDLSEQVSEIGFHDWNKPESHETCY